MHTPSQRLCGSRLLSVQHTVRDPLIAPSLGICPQMRAYWGVSAATEVKQYYSEVSRGGRSNVAESGAVVSASRFLEIIEGVRGLILIWKEAPIGQDS